MKRSAVWSTVLAAGAACVVPLIARTVNAPAPPREGPQQIAAVREPERLPDGIRLEAAGGFLTVQVRTDRIVRVTFAKERTFRADPMVVVAPGETPAGAALNPFSNAVHARRPVPIPRWTLTSDPRTLTVATARLRADRQPVGRRGQLC